MLSIRQQAAVRLVLGRTREQRVGIQTPIPSCFYPRGPCPRAIPFPGAGQYPKETVGTTCQIGKVKTGRKDAN